MIKSSKSFSELKSIAADCGLSFSDETGELKGKMRGYDILVGDSEIGYEAVISAAIASEKRGAINEIAEKLPKNAVIKMSFSETETLILLDKNRLMQENIVYLAAFLDNLTAYLYENNIASITNNMNITNITQIKADYSAHSAKNDETISAKSEKKTAKPVGSIKKGIFGAILGGIVGVLVFLAAVRISGYISFLGGAAIGFLCVFMYRRFGKSFSAAGIIVCSLITAAFAFIAAHFSMIIDLYGSVSALESISVFDVYANFDSYIVSRPEIGGAFLNNLLICFLFAAFAAGGTFVWHFSRNESDMY